MLALFGAFLAGSSFAQQQGAGYVANLSGPLFAVKADGSRRILSVQSTVEPGDTLVTEDKTYARVRFTDTSEVTFRPQTQFQVAAYNFDRESPEKDNVAFRLIKGAMRTVTGLVGKRSTEVAYRLDTPTATMGIRGTTFGVTVCVPGTCGNLAPGTYVNVIEGRVAVAPLPTAMPTMPMPGVPVPSVVPSGVPATAPSADAAAPAPVAAPVAAPAAAPAAAPLVAPTVSAPVTPLPAAPVLLAAGQFGYVPTAGPPVQLPSDPGVGRLFAPPVTFTQKQDAPPPALQQQPGVPAQKAPAPAASECVVR